MSKEVGAGGRFDIFWILSGRSVFLSIIAELRIGQRHLKQVTCVELITLQKYHFVLFFACCCYKLVALWEEDTMAWARNEEIV